MDPPSRPTSAAGEPILPSASPVDPELRRGGWVDLLRNRRFLLMEASGSFAGAGYAVYAVSVLFLAYRISGNLVIAGVVLFIEYGVYTATFLVAPFVDRAKNKRTILLACYPVQAAAAAALGFGIRTGTLSIPALLGLVLVLAIMWDFVWAVFMIAPRIVLERRQLFVADGFSSAISVGTQVGGYAGGAVLLYVVGPYGGAFAYVVLLIGAFVAAVPLSLTIENPPTSQFWETFRRGWDSFRKEAKGSLRQLAALEALYGFFVSVPPLLITAVAFERFSAPAAAYGALITAYTVGGSIAGIGIGHLNPRRAVGVLLVGGPVAAGLLVFALAPAPSSVVLLGLLLAGIGAAFSIRYIAKYSWVQASFPPESLGRINANLYLFTGFAGSAAVLVVGLLSGSVSLSDLVLIDGAGLVAVGVLAAFLPFIRRLSF
ncbi:MAG: hypothetical protein WAN87_03785 [Thermoplasmata archaeon]